MTLALVSSGRSLSDASSADEAAVAGIAACIHLLDRARAAFGRRLLERGGADGDDLLRVLGLHRRDGVAGIDRPRERVRALDREDVADLHDVEQRGDARGDVLAGGGGRSDEGVVALHQLRGDGCDGFGELVLQRRRIGDIDLGHAGDFRRRLRDAIGIVADDQRMDFAELRRGGHGRQRRVLDVAAVMFDQDQNAHFAIPMPFSRSTSSSTLPTLIPAWRLAGSTTFSVSSRRATSTP